MNNQQDQNKIVLFPGMVDKLVTKAYEEADRANYHEANEYFNQLLEYGVRDEKLLSIYAHSLYEMNEFVRAKEVCEQLLDMKPQFYVEAMELYLTICMQLKQFQQVEKLIDTLFYDGVIPIQERERFERIQQINEDLAYRNEYTEDEVQLSKEFDLQESEFLQLPIHSQLLQVQQLAELNIRPYVQIIKSLIENRSIHPFIQSLLLILLVEQEVNMDVMVQKLGFSQLVNPADMNLPTMLSQFQQVSRELSARFEHNPSVQEMLGQMLSKHAIVAYPFEWQPYSVEDVVGGYEHFMKMMFGDEGTGEYAIISLIEQLEMLGELQVT